MRSPQASTPAEHRGSRVTLTLATRYRHWHVALAPRGTRIEQATMLHDHLAELSRDAAKEATAAAEMHKQLAGIGR